MHRLVGTVLVVMGFELVQAVAQMGFVPDQRAVEEFAPTGPYPPFHDRVHPRNTYAGQDGLDPGVVEDPVEQGGEVRVPVSDQIADCAPASSRSITRFLAA
jgi:hypothetical protein